MALTEQQDIPEKPKVNEPWSFKRLLSFGTITTLAKVFINPFDVLLGYLVFILGIAELLGRSVSSFVWTFAVLVLTADLIERHIHFLLEKEPKEKK